MKYGVWENGQFIGAVVYAHGASPYLGNPYALTATEVCELVRVALTDHTHSVTSIVAWSLRLLTRSNPGLRLVVSFADEGQGHLGTIYQAGNWIYTGPVEHQWYRVNGTLIHPKTLHSTYGIGGQSVPWLRAHVDPNAERVSMAAKHRYLMPLDRAMRRKIEPLAVPFPRGRGLNGEPPADQAVEAGSIPAARSSMRSR